MKLTSADLKRLARDVLRGHYGLLIGAVLVTALIVFAVFFPFYFILLLRPNVVSVIIFYIVFLLITMIGILLQSGISYIHLGLVRKREVYFSDLFYAFTIRPDRFILAYLLLLIILMIANIPYILFLVGGILTGFVPLILLSVLFFLAGLVVMIFLALKYAYVFFLLLDHKTMGVIKSFQESARIMKGNTGRLFYIYLSFLGWICLGLLSCYVGFLWITPYMSQTLTNFYLEIIGELDEKEPVLFPASADIREESHTVDKQHFLVDGNVPDRTHSVEDIDTSEQHSLDDKPE